jgi:hypothetical protein
MMTDPSYTKNVANAIIDRITSNREIYNAITDRLAYKNTTMLLPEMGEIGVGEIDATIMKGGMMEVETKSLLERLLTTRLGVHVQCVQCDRSNSWMSVCLSLFPPERKWVLPNTVFGHLREREPWQLLRSIPRDIEPQLVISTIRAQLSEMGEEVGRQMYEKWGAVYFKVSICANHPDLFYNEPYVDFWNLFIKESLEEQLGCKCDSDVYLDHKIIRLLLG